MKKFRPHPLAAALSILTLPALTQTAYAAASGPIDEIIVTAQKRVQAISDVGMSINAVTGDTLKDLGITSSADLNKIAPGLSIVPANTGISGAPVFTLRGVGFNENSLSALSAVSFYVDEIPLPYVYMAGGPTLDIERVEVLKGPQGTLFGQNATGGAINYIARHPTEHFEAGIEGSWGTYGRVDANGYVSGPLSDTLKARLAVRSVTADGWQKSTSHGGKLGEVDQQSGRFILDWNPTNTLLVELNLNGWLDRSETQAAQMVGYNPSVSSQTDPTDFSAFNFAYPSLSQVLSAPIKPNDPRKADWTEGYDYHNHSYFNQQSLRVEWDMSDDITLTSLTASSRFRKHDFHDTDANAGEFNTYVAAGSIKAFSQELRLNGEVWDRLNWITGVSYADDTIKGNNISKSLNSSLGYFAGLLGADTLASEERKTKAIFASGDFDLSDSLSMTTGIRYTDVSLDYSGCSRALGNDWPGVLPGACFTNFATGNAGVISRSFDENNTSWRLGLNWKVTSDTLLYATYSRGFKSGDIPTLVAISDAQLNPVVQERLDAFEIGFKTQLFDNAVSVSGAAFYYDYKDKQLYALVKLPPPLGIVGESTINIPKSKVEGAELDLTWRPLNGLTLHTGIGYTHSEITKADPQYAGLTSSTWPPATGFVSTDLVEVEGDPFNLAPEWQVNFDGQYQWSINDSLNAFVGASAVYASQTSSYIGASDAAGIPEYGTVDLRAGVESADGIWRATLWGRNVTDENYTVTVSRGFDATTRFVGQPATYGVTVGYKFD